MGHPEKLPYHIIVSDHPTKPDLTLLLQVPKTHCPDVLTLGLIQINPPLTNFRTEVLAQMLQIFLANHPNSGVILNYAWHSNTLNLKGVVMHAMGEWYRSSQVGLIVDFSYILVKLSQPLTRVRFSD